MGIHIKNLIVSEHQKKFQAVMKALGEKFKADRIKDVSDAEICEYALTDILSAIEPLLGEGREASRAELLHKMKRFDTEEPDVAHAQKLLNYIGAQEYQKVADYMQKLIALTSNTKSASQKLIAKTPRTNELDDVIRILVKEDPNISARKLLAQLKATRFTHIVIVAAKSITLIKSKKTLHISGLNSRLTRVRSLMQADIKTTKYK